VHLNSSWSLISRPMLGRTLLPILTPADIGLQRGYPLFDCVDADRTNSLTICNDASLWGFWRRSIFFALEDRLRYGDLELGYVAISRARCEATRESTRNFHALKTLDKWIVAPSSEGPRIYRWCTLA